MSKQKTATIESVAQQIYTFKGTDLELDACILGAKALEQKTALSMPGTTKISLEDRKKFTTQGEELRNQLKEATTAKGFIEMVKKWFMSKDQLKTQEMTKLVDTMKSVLSHSHPTVDTPPPLRSKSSGLEK